MFAVLPVKMVRTHTYLCRAEFRNESVTEIGPPYARDYQRREVVSGWQVVPDAPHLLVLELLQ